jgi:hypothetical protein
MPPEVVLENLAYDLGCIPKLWHGSFVADERGWDGFSRIGKRENQSRLSLSYPRTSVSIRPIRDKKEIAPLSWDAPYDLCAG